MIRSDIDLTFAEAALGALNARLTDMTPVMFDLGEYLVTSTKDRFPTGTARTTSVNEPGRGKTF